MELDNKKDQKNAITSCNIHTSSLLGQARSWNNHNLIYIYYIYIYREREREREASKNCAPDREREHIRHSNFIEEPKISGTLLRYVLSYCFLDTSLPYYFPLFLRYFFAVLFPFIFM